MLDAWLNRPDSISARLLNASARRLATAGVGANLLSHAALACGILAGLLFYVDHRWHAFLAILLSGGLDALDGRVARLGRGSTAWGGVLDLTYDRIVEAAVLLGVALPRPEWHVPALVLAATWYINLCVFLAVGAASDRHSEKVIHYPPGLLERTEALVFAFIATAFPGIAPSTGYVYAALGLLTAAQRFRYGHRALSAES